MCSISCTHPPLECRGDRRDMRIAGCSACTGFSQFPFRLLLVDIPCESDSPEKRVLRTLSLEFVHSSHVPPHLYISCECGAANSNSPSLSGLSIRISSHILFAASVCPSNSFHFTDSCGSWPAFQARGISLSHRYGFWSLDGAR